MLNFRSCISIYVQWAQSILFMDKLFSHDSYKGVKAERLGLFVCGGMALASLMSSGQSVDNLKDLLMATNTQLSESAKRLQENYLLLEVQTANMRVINDRSILARKKEKETLGLFSDELVTKYAGFESNISNLKFENEKLKNSVHDLLSISGTLNQHMMDLEEKKRSGVHSPSLSTSSQIGDLGHSREFNSVGASKNEVPVVEYLTAGTDIGGNDDVKSGLSSGSSYDPEYYVSPPQSLSHA